MKQQFILPALLIMLSILFLLSSCSIQKRTHMNGYSIEWNRNKPGQSKSVHVNSSDSPPLPTAKATIDSLEKKRPEPATNLDLAVFTDSQLVASNTNEILVRPQSKRLANKRNITPDTSIITSKNIPMDTLKLTKKEEITVKVEEDLKKEKSLLSTLWTFVTLNYLYCDIAGLMDAAILSQYLAGIVGGMVISSGFLLAAGILMEIPISMVLFSRILKSKGNRNANIIAGIIMTLVQIATLFAGPVTAYYLFFSIIEIAATAFITWYAWKKFKKKEISE